MVLATQNRSKPKEPIRCPRRRQVPVQGRDRLSVQPVEAAVVSRATAGQAGDELRWRTKVSRSPQLKAQQLAAQQRVDEQVIDYAVRMVRATRDWAGVAMGSGSRGALALVRGGRAVALLDGRNYVTPDDIKRIALPALRHRIALSPDALLEGRTTNDLLAEVIETTAAPRV
jgi:MoxR-like ATPase